MKIIKKFFPKKGKKGESKKEALEEAQIISLLKRGELLIPSNKEDYEDFETLVKTTRQYPEIQKKLKEVYYGASKKEKITS